MLLFRKIENDNILWFYMLQEIDAYIMQASDKGYSAVISLGSKGISYATNVVLNTAIKVS